MLPNEWVVEGVIVKTVWTNLSISEKSREGICTGGAHTDGEMSRVI